MGQKPVLRLEKLVEDLPEAQKYVGIYRGTM